MSRGPARNVLICLPRSQARAGAFVVNAEADRAWRGSSLVKQQSRGAS
jgi:hypothetical protein